MTAPAAPRLFPGLSLAPGRMSANILLTCLCALLVVVVLLAVDKGAVEISVAQQFSIVAGKLGFQLPWRFTAEQEATLLYIRLPRVLTGVLVGAGLGVSGAAMQGLFRNPLADPGLVGVSSGAALAATALVVIGDAVSLSLFKLPTAIQLLAFPAAAFAGAFVTSLLIYRLATIAGQTVVATLLLAGVAVNALAQAVSGFVIFYATDAQIRSLTFWKLGSLGGASWGSLGILAPFVLVPILIFPRLARALNAMLLGESEAGHLGVNVERVKKEIIVLVSLTVGASVAFTGLIGFVGLVVPHLMRLLVGPDHRKVLPGSALLGASLLVVADLVARTVAAPAELPIGVLTAIIGAPFFLWLLLRDRKWRVIH